MDAQTRKKQEKEKTIAKLKPAVKLWNPSEKQLEQCRLCRYFVPIGRTYAWDDVLDSRRTERLKKIRVVGVLASVPACMYAIYNDRLRGEIENPGACPSYQKRPGKADQNEYQRKRMRGR